MSRRVAHHHRLILKTANESVEHIKWCRRNLGQRGTDWDFSGSRHLDIMIYTEKYVPFYMLIFG